MKQIKLLVIIFTISITSLFGDEGMWTFNNPPYKLLKERYNFKPTKEWLEKIQLSSVRFNDGGSGSFISSTGLVLTNHHVALGQLQKMSSPEIDYVKVGFYANSNSKEIKCTDLELNVLISMENVTAKINSAVKSDMNPKDALEARKKIFASLEKESAEKTKLRSDIVTLYNGGEYWIYRYKKYTDVRLVFAPEQQIAFYGGDPDNFTFPRYDLDMTIFRIYENDKPLQSTNFLKWNSAGASENELVFVSGHPGSTNRLQTMAQFNFNRDYSYPARLKTFKFRIAALKKFSALNPENARKAKGQIFSLENSLKASLGEYDGLKNPAITATKQKEENELRSRLSLQSELNSKYSSSWSDIELAYKKLISRYNDLLYRSLAGSTLASRGLTLVRYINETAKEDSKRLDGYHEAQLASLKMQLFSPAPIYSDMEEFVISARLNEIISVLGENDQFVKMVLKNKSIEQTAKALSTSELINPDFRKKLSDGGIDALNNSTDPMIVLMREYDAMSREMITWQDENILSVVTPAGEKIGKALFAVYGSDKSPDATFTLRLAYGSVKGYPMNGTIAPYKTVYGGLFTRAMEFDNKGDFELPKNYWDKKNKINPYAPLNFVSTCDIIGGNSGSPVINTKGEIVGLIFDGNIESLVGRFVYDETSNRSVSVHTGGMMEAMRNIYDATELANEIENNN